VEAPAAGDVERADCEEENRETDEDEVRHESHQQDQKNREQPEDREHPPVLKHESRDVVAGRRSPLLHRSDRSKVVPHFFSLETGA
jgi:hypothetical protein